MLDKVIAKQFMDNFNRLLSKYKITNRQISKNIGRPENSFNKILNEMQNPRIATVLRYFEEMNSIIKSDPKYLNVNLQLDELIDKDMTLTINIANQIPVADIEQLIVTNKNFFKSLNVYFTIHPRNVFTDKEIVVYETIKQMLNE